VHEIEGNGMQNVKRLIERHPRLAAWLVLAIAMLIVFFITSANAPLAPTQQLTIAGALVGLAGLCVWIVFWEE
jgi:hypothetical protein